MKVKQLIKKLQKFNPESEVKMKEIGCSNVRDIDDVSQGWYLDNEFDAPDFIDESDDPSLYDIDPKQEKIVCIE